AWVADITACFADTAAWVANITACSADTTARVTDITACSEDTTAWVAETVYLLADAAFGSKKINLIPTNQKKAV
ncbi:hypothetical protein CSC81_01470, partial [Tenacibaculum discolor]